MRAMNSVYAQRRAALEQHLGPGAIALIPTAPERARNRDSDFLYRHDSYFYYLTGFTEPQAWLVLTGDGHSTLFCQPKDLERETWDGIRLGPQAAIEALGVNSAYSVNELDTRLPRLLENHASVWYPFATHSGLAARVDAIQRCVAAAGALVARADPQAPLRIALAIVGALVRRVIRQACKALQRAAPIAGAVNAAAQRGAPGNIDPIQPHLRA